MAERIFSKSSTGEMLLRDYRTNRVSHAYMFIGADGAGKQTLAKAFSKLLMCENPNGDTPCGECAGCKYFESFGEHPNLTVIGLKDKTVISVKDVRDALDGVFTAPYIGSKKIYIIKNAEKLGASSQNALLKILEEPPEYAVFFLLTNSRYAMLNTVISRCRVLNMAPYNHDAMLEILNEKKPELSAEEKNTLLSRSQGLPGKLISLLESDEAERKSVISAVSALLSDDMEIVLDSVKDIDSREKALSFCRILNEFMRDSMLLSAGGSKEALFDPDQTELYNKIIEKSTLKKLTAFVFEINETVKMLSGNVTFQLCVKNLLLKW